MWAHDIDLPPYAERLADIERSAGPAVVEPIAASSVRTRRRPGGPFATRPPAGWASHDRTDSPPVPATAGLAPSTPAPRSSASRRRATRRRPPSSSAVDDVRSSVVSSQVDIHARFGGVVPEIASRAHVDLLTPVIAAGARRGGRRRLRHRRRRRHHRSGPGRLPARRRQLGQGARARLGRAVRGGQPPRGAPVRRLPRGPGAPAARWSSCWCRAATRC